MTREKLAELDPNKVRKDKTLFALFKQYITEDNNGVTPQGCLGCSFPKHFSEWRSNYLTQKTSRKMSNSTGITYELKDAKYRVYFNGKVLGSKSTDAEWVEWLQYPEQAEKKSERADKFEVLPEEVREEKPKKTPKKSASKKAADEPADGSEEVREEKAETNE